MKKKVEVFGVPVRRSRIRVTVELRKKFERKEAVSEQSTLAWGTPTRYERFKYIGRLASAELSVDGSRGGPLGETWAWTVTLRGGFIAKRGGLASAADAKREAEVIAAALLVAVHASGGAGWAAA